MNEIWALVEGNRGRVFLRRDAATAVPSRGCALAIRAVGRLARRRSRGIGGLGQWATWSTKRSTLLVYKAQLANTPDLTRRAVAIALARQLL